jgi:predicted transcriptional regulator
MHAQDRYSVPSYETEIDATILRWLIESQAPWSTDEVARELRDDSAAEDALIRLTTAGLVHKLDRFVFPTRAGVRAAQLPLEA